MLHCDEVVVALDMGGKRCCAAQGAKYQHRSKNGETSLAVRVKDEAHEA